MNPSESNNSDKKDSQSLSPQVIERLIHVQSEEVKVRAEEAKNRGQEIELAKYREDKNHQFASKQLEAQEKFLHNLPKERREDRKQIFLFICGLISLFVAIGILAHFGGHTSDYFEMMKQIGVFLAGAATGAGGTYINIRSKENRADIIEEE